MQTITLVDTSISTDNLGDEIIMEAVENVVFSLFPDAYYYRVPSHELLSYRTRAFLRRSDYCFVGGSNLLSSQMGRNAQWRMRWIDTVALNRAICLGVGWNDYSRDPNWSSRLMLRAMLDGGIVHSVRDAYTEQRLSQVGVRCVNTACPTMWTLTRPHCRTVPRCRAGAVVFTLTAWRPDPQADRELIALLRSHYRRVYFFAQMREDYDYFRRFDNSAIEVVKPTLQGYTALLASEDIDYVGTRLHGGIRALQMGRRTLVIGVDNRGVEIHRDTGLPMVPRADTAAIERWIEGDEITELSLPWSTIEQWRDQFGAVRDAAPSATERMAMT
jgi:polysaccharide pyruvyl transferase WcaK-like protein